MSAVAPAAATPPRPRGAIVAALRVADLDVRVRATAAADAAFCRGLFHEERAPQFAALGLSDAMLTALLDQQYRAQQLGYQQNWPDADDAVIEHRGRSVGRLMLALLPEPPGAGMPISEARGGASHLGAGTLHLIDIGISAAARGDGIGTAVIGSLAGAAAMLGASRLSLCVLRGNVRARRLYQRLGFVAGAGDSHIAMIKELRCSGR